MLALTLRRQHILTGAIATLLLFAAITVGVKGSFGAFKGGYELIGSFDAAGQGLLPGSDVKIRGVNVGEVQNIRLVDGDALVRLRINDGEMIPVDATATIRPKTLFGEKFVDIAPGETEATGPFLADGDTIARTLGGFELEAVLTDLYPLLKAIDPDELVTVLGELADGGRGLGDEVNRSIVNGAELSALFADNAELTSRFLRDMAALSGELGKAGDDIVGLADAGNAVLPTINDNEDDLVELLRQAGRLSADVADLLVDNRPFVDASLGGGSDTIQVLYDQRNQVVPLVIGLRQYAQTLATTIRIDMGDGTLMAAVKAVLGGDACGVLPCPGTTAASASAPTGGAGAGAPPPGTTPGDGLVPDPGSDDGSGLYDLLTRVLGS